MTNNTEQAIRQKLIKSGLFKEEQQLGNAPCCSSKLELPDELPSVEESLKALAATLKALEKPGLERNEVFRSRFWSVTTCTLID